MPRDNVQNVVAVYDSQMAEDIPRHETQQLLQILISTAVPVSTNVTENPGGNLDFCKATESGPRTCSEPLLCNSPAHLVAHISE